MTDALWLKVKHFSPNEAWGNPNKMCVELIYKLDKYREAIKVPIYVHSGTGGTHYLTGEHPKGNAIDGHANIDLLDLYIQAERIGFTGIGLYEDFIHLDMRLKVARWTRIDGKYLALTAETLDEVRKRYKVLYL